MTFWKKFTRKGGKPDSIAGPFSPASSERPIEFGDVEIKRIKKMSRLRADGSRTEETEMERVGAAIGGFAILMIIVVLLLILFFKWIL